MLAELVTVEAVEHTLEELLCSILLVEGVVDDWSAKVVDHRLEGGSDLLLCVAGVMLEDGILINVSSERQMRTWQDVPIHPSQGSLLQGAWKQQH